MCSDSLELREHEHVIWSGTLRAAIEGRSVYLRPVQKLLPVWTAVGGTPESVIRAGILGLPLAIAIIGGSPARFKPLAELCREAGRRAGQDDLKLSINAHGYIAYSTQQALDESFPYYEVTMNKIGRKRGWPPMTRAEFNASAEPDGHLILGSPQ